MGIRQVKTSHSLLFWLQFSHIFLIFFLAAPGLCWGVWLSLVAVFGLVALRHVGSYSSLERIEPTLPLLEGRLLTTGPPGKSLGHIFLKKKQKHTNTPQVFKSFNFQSWKSWFWPFLPALSLLLWRSIFLEVLTLLSWKCFLSTCLCTENCTGTQPCPFIYIIYSCSHRAMEELSSCNRNHMASKAWNMYYLALAEKVCQRLW